MNILILLKTYPAIGGVEKVTTVLSSQFVQNGHNVIIVSGQCEKEIPEFKPDPRIKYLNLPEANFGSDLNSKFFVEILALNNVDVIINQGLYWDVNVLLINTRYQITISIVTVFHNSVDSFIQSIITAAKSDDLLTKIIKYSIWPFYLIYYRNKIKSNLKLIYNVSDLFVLLSQSFQNDVERLLGYRDNKLRFIPNGLPLVDIDIDSVIENKRNQVLYVGRLVNSQKKIERLIDIWAKLHIRFPEWSLVLVGTGIDEDSFKMKCHTLGIQNVKFEGFQNDVSQYYREADIVCLTSDFEGFGMVLIEGMQWGCIPIAYNSYSSLEDIIDQNVNGYTIPPFNEFAYMQKLILLMENSDLRYTLAKEARVKSRTFDSEKIYGHWNKLMDEAINLKFKYKKHD